MLRMGGAHGVACSLLLVLLLLFADVDAIARDVARGDLEDAAADDDSDGNEEDARRYVRVQR